LKQPDRDHRKRNLSPIALATRSSGRQSSAHQPDKTTELILTFDDNRQAGLVFGQYDQNLVHLENRLNITANANGNHVILRGLQDAAEQAKYVLEMLYARVGNGQPLSVGDVDGAIQEIVHQGVLFPDAPEKTDLKANFEHISTRRRGPVRARTSAQDGYIRALRAHELVFAEGPAGTGKTWLAVGHAVSLLEQGVVDRLVLSRPAVEAGERLGFLPGDMRDKVDPYLRPIYDALYDFMEARHVERGLETGMIEIAPLAFMRGRTLTHCVVLLDEAQNTTSMQMKMFLTRLGEGSRMIVTGDPSQVDLPSGQVSGLTEAIRILKGVEGIGHIAFKEADVVRHDLVRRIVRAYENTPQGGSSTAREAQEQSLVEPSRPDPDGQKLPHALIRPVSPRPHSSNPLEPHS
jgi:phosphate starvation-inducible protein PhoH and related proteins